MIIKKIINEVFYIIFNTVFNVTNRFAMKIQKLRIEKNKSIIGNIKIGNYTKINVSGESKLKTNNLELGDFSFITILGNSTFTTGSNACLQKYCSFNLWNANVIFGNNVLFNNYCSLNSIQEIIIGNNTWFGEGVRLYDHNHKYKDRTKSFAEQGFSAGKIVIGDNCWIGSNTIILQNVIIGDNCIIGANNLIHKSLAPNSIVKANTSMIIDDLTKNN
jgi:acetyltransferase-like isoleucine patch superfamily enzyme